MEHAPERLVVVVVGQPKVLPQLPGIPVLEPRNWEECVACALAIGHLAHNIQWKAAIWRGGANNSAQGWPVHFGHDTAVHSVNAPQDKLIQDIRKKGGPTRTARRAPGPNCRAGQTECPTTTTVALSPFAENLLGSRLVVNMRIGGSLVYPNLIALADGLSSAGSQLQVDSPRGMKNRRRYI